MRATHLSSLVLEVVDAVTFEYGHGQVIRCLAVVIVDKTRRIDRPFVIFSTLSGQFAKGDTKRDIP